MPTGVAASERDPLLTEEDRVRDALKASGFTELVTYSFVSVNSLSASSIDLVSSRGQSIVIGFRVHAAVVITRRAHGHRAESGMFPEGRVFEVVMSRSAIPACRKNRRRCWRGLWFAGRRHVVQGVERRARSVLSGRERGEVRTVTDAPRWHPGRSAAVASATNASGVGNASAV